MMLKSPSLVEVPYEMSSFCESPHVKLRTPLQNICNNQHDERTCVSFNEKANSYYDELRTNLNFEDLWYAREDYKAFKVDLLHAVDDIRKKQYSCEPTVSPRETLSKFYDYCYYEEDLSENDPKISKEDWIELNQCYKARFEDILGLEKLIEQRLVLDSCELKQVTLALIHQFQNDEYQNKFIRASNIATVCEEASLGSRLFAHVIAIPLAPSTAEIIRSTQVVVNEYQSCEI